MDEDSDEASLLKLRQQVLDEWDEGEKKDVVLEALDRLLLEKRRIRAPDIRPVVTP